MVVIQKWSLTQVQLHIICFRKCISFVCCFAVSKSGVNFTNVLRTAFMILDPKSVKNTVMSSVSFMLLGSARVKALRRTLMKLSPDNVFILHLAKYFFFLQVCKLNRVTTFSFFVQIYGSVSPEDMCGQCSKNSKEALERGRASSHSGQL